MVHIYTNVKVKESGIKSEAYVISLVIFVIRQGRTDAFQSH